MTSASVIALSVWSLLGAIGYTGVTIDYDVRHRVPLVYWKRLLVAVVFGPLAVIMLVWETSIYLMIKLALAVSDLIE